MQLPEGLIDKVKKFLGDEGIEFFRSCKEEHGTLSPVLKIVENDKIIYWPVEWHEGRQIRDLLLKLDEYKNEDIDTLENLWRALVDQIIE